MKMSIKQIIVDGLQVVISDLKIRVLSQSKDHFEPPYEPTGIPQLAYTITLDSVEYHPTNKPPPDQVREIDEEANTATMESKIAISGIRCFLPTRESPVLWSKSDLYITMRSVLWMHVGGRTRMTPFPLESLMDIDLAAMEAAGSNEEVSRIIFLLLDLCVSVLVPAEALQESDSHLHWLNATQERPSSLFRTRWSTSGSPHRRNSTESMMSFQSMDSASDIEDLILEDFDIKPNGTIPVNATAPAQNTMPPTPISAQVSRSSAVSSSTTPSRPTSNSHLARGDHQNSSLVDRKTPNSDAPPTAQEIPSGTPASSSGPPNRRSTQSRQVTSPSPPSDSIKKPSILRLQNPLHKTVMRAVRNAEKLGQQAVNDTQILANSTGRMVTGTKHILFGQKKDRGRLSARLSIDKTMSANSYAEFSPSESSGASSVEVPPPPPTARSDAVKFEEWTAPAFADEDPDLEYRDLVVTRFGSVNDKFHLRIGNLKIRALNGVVVELEGLDYSSDNLGRLTSFERDLLAVLGYAITDTFKAKNIPEDPRLRISNTSFITITSLKATGAGPVIEVKCDELKALTLKWRSPGVNPDPSPESDSWNPMEGCIHNVTVIMDPAEEWDKFMEFYNEGVSPGVTDFMSGDGPTRWQRILFKDIAVKLANNKKVVIPEIAMSNAADMGQLVCTLQCLPSVPERFHNLEKKVRTRLGAKKGLCICTRDVTLQQKSARPLSIGSTFGERQFRIALASSSSRDHKNPECLVFNEKSSDTRTNGLYISTSEYQEMLKTKADYERLQMSERMAKQQVNLVAETLATYHVNQTFEGVRNFGLSKKEQLSIMRDKMAALQIELQTQRERTKLTDKTKSELVKAMQKQVVDSEITTLKMRTAYEERQEEMRHTQLALLETIERQKKALDSLITKRGLGTGST
eukprot:GEMP01005662.1.p1 GENE.GEMP01005662.1~~GEMP01005662.1.p1  ORF type:complete len:917 (+),score=139.88 GEMP01005662.1:508-3258(+)